MMTRENNHGPKQACWIGRLSALLPLLVFIWFALQVPHIATGGRMQVSLPWVPSLGVELKIVLDGLAVLYGLIITGVGTLIMMYADGYLGRHPHMVRFFLYLHLFLLSMLGLVLCDNLLVIFVFWELTSLFSFLLIGFEHNSGEARQSARQALLVTGGGGLLLLVGMVLIGQVSQTYGLSELTRQGDYLRHHSLYVPIFLCVVAGAFTKSAQFPFHFWLPNAMAAPAPISALLHSATMVKAGLYLLARLHPILGGTMIWMSTLVVIGAVTAVWGSIVALGQSDLKRILAHTTIMALGIVTMFLGSRTTPALTAAMTFLLVHAIYKSALFLVVGSVDHQAGTRQIQEIGGIGRSMPFTALAASMATLSMAGFPLFLGFVGKEIMYKGALTETVFPGLAVAAALSANALMAAVAIAIGLRPMWGKSRSSHTIIEAPWSMWIGPLLLSCIGLGFGLIPDWVRFWLIQPAVRSFHPTTETIKLKLFYGFNEPLLLSVITLCLGVGLYWQRLKIRQGILHFIQYLPLSLSGIFDWLLDGIAWVADRQTRILQSGSLFSYLSIIIGFLLLTLGWAMSTWRGLDFTLDRSTLSAWQGLLVISMLVSIVVVVRSTSKLQSICALGVVGAGIALIFLSFGAPDVALTQLLVETLTLIIAAIVLLRLPRIMPSDPRSGLSKHSLRLILSIGSGVVVTVLLALISQQNPDRTITEFYEKASYVKAHGRNIVNVILVDFRSLDTLGEIIVVAISAIASICLINRKGKPL
jgi:multicomponent Na+:H+ antiporter subunit A